ARSKTYMICSRGDSPASGGGRRPDGCAARRSRLAASISSLVENSLYIERFDTPAALHSASTPTLTPSRYESVATASRRRSRVPAEAAADIGVCLGVCVAGLCAAVRALAVSVLMASKVQRRLDSGNRSVYSCRSRKPIGFQLSCRRRPRRTRHAAHPTPPWALPESRHAP